MLINSSAVAVWVFKSATVIFLAIRSVMTAWSIVTFWAVRCTAWRLPTPAFPARRFFTLIISALIWLDSIILADSFSIFACSASRIRVVILSAEISFTSRYFMKAVSTVSLSNIPSFAFTSSATIMPAVIVPPDPVPPVVVPPNIELNRGFEKICLIASDVMT